MIGTPKKMSNEIKGKMGVVHPMDTGEVKKVFSEVDYFRGVIRRYRYDFFGWCREVLGYTDMNEEHRGLCQVMEGSGLRKLILMPRYTFKSCVCTVGYSLWELMKDPNVRILIYSDATSKAQGFLTEIKNHVEGKSKGSKFRYVFGGWETDPRDGKWNESMVIVRTRYEAHAEPSIETAGIETSLVGRHYDIIIFDDIVSDKNVTTKEQMDKVYECYTKALSLLRPGGKVVMVGTRWHFGDLYGRLLAENKVTKVWDTYVKAAEEGGKLLFADIGQNSLTKEFLDQQRMQQGSYTYSCLYMNSPVDDETAVFKPSSFAFYGAVRPDGLYVTGTCDPAGEGEDFTSIVVVGTDADMTMYVLEVVNEHLKPDQIVDRILMLHEKYKFVRFGVEENFFRGMLKMELERKMWAKVKCGEVTAFSVDEFIASSKRGESKYARIMGLQPYHERGAIRFPGDCVELQKGAFAELAFQMIQFPKAPHDDAVDALAYHLQMIRKGGVARKKEPPRRSAAWIEKRRVDEMCRKNESVPRRLRMRVPTMAFN